MKFFDLFRRKEKKLFIFYIGKLDIKNEPDTSFYSVNNQTVSFLYEEHMMMQEILKHSFTKTLFVGTREPEGEHLLAVKVGDVQGTLTDLTEYQLISPVESLNGKRMKFCNSRLRDFFKVIPDKLYVVPHTIKLQS